MNKQTLAACIFAAITLGVSSCFLFEKNNPQVSEKTIIGRWKIDSIDDSHFKPVGEDPIQGPLLLEPAYSDAIKTTVVFAADSVYTLRLNDSSKTDSSKYYFDSSAQKLFVKDGATFTACNIAAQNDSIFDVELTQPKVHYIIKKQP